MQKNPSESKAWWHRFQSLLDGQLDWPTEYLFKFIVPKAHLEEMKGVFEGHPVKVRASRKGNYMSVTARMPVESSDEVLSIYQAAAEVEGVISL